MKPINIVLIVVAVFVFTVAFLTYRARKKEKITAAKDNSKVNTILATNSVTTIVDPTTGDEYIISSIGENNIDNGTGSNNMRSAISAVISDIDNRTGSQPLTFTIRSYTPTGALIGQKSISNPNKKNLPKGTTAFENLGINGMTDYSCSGGLNLQARHIIMMIQIHNYLGCFVIKNYGSSNDRPNGREIIKKQMVLDHSWDHRCYYHYPTVLG